MTKEVFEKKLSTLLNVLCCVSIADKGSIRIYGGGASEGGPCFYIMSNEPYLFNVEFGFGDNSMTYVKNVSYDEVKDMFSDYLINEINALHISVVI